MTFRFTAKSYAALLKTNCQQYFDGTIGVDVWREKQAELWDHIARVGLTRPVMTLVDPLNGESPTRLGRRV